MPAPNLGNLTAGDVLYLTFEGRQFNQRILSTFYYRCVSPGSGPISRWDAYESFKNGLIVVGGLRAEFLNVMSSTYTLEHIRLQYVFPSRRMYRRFTDGSVGQLLSPVDTANVVASIERRAAVVGREGIGRLQIGGLTQAAMLNGVLDVGFKAQLQTLATFMTFNLLMGALNDEEWEPVLYGETPLGLAHINPIVDAFPHDTVRTMSRRTVGRGE